jgi:hypothetical protein
MDMPLRVRIMWRYERAVGYMKNHFFGKKFKEDVSTMYKVKL